MNTRATAMMGWRWGFWFRIRGWGLHIKPSRNHVKLFSERFGCRRALYVLGLRIEVLTPTG